MLLFSLKNKTKTCPLSLKTSILLLLGDLHPTLGEYISKEVGDGEPRSLTVPEPVRTQKA